MRKVREVLRLKCACGASDARVLRSLLYYSRETRGFVVGRTAIGEYIRRPR